MVPEEIEVGAHGLVLRQWRTTDAPRLLAAVEASIPELRRFMSWAMEEPTLETVGAYLEKVASDAALAFGLFEAGGELVGSFGLPERRGPGILEIGYWVRSDRTRRGYATAAARALTAVAFDCFPLVDRIEIRCDPANLASAAIPPKLGYRLDRTEAVEVEAEGQTGKQQVWVLDRVEWLTWRPSADRPAPPAAPPLR